MTRFSYDLTDEGDQPFFIKYGIMTVRRLKHAYKPVYGICGLYGHIFKNMFRIPLYMDFP